MPRTSKTDLQAYLARLDESIRKTEHRLREFEAAYGMSSGDFYRKLLADEIEATPDYDVWAGEIVMLEQLKAKRASLRGG